MIQVKIFNYMRATLAFIGFLLLFSCKKEDANYYLEGKITDARNGQALSAVNTEVQKQVISNGIYGGTFSLAARTSTDNGGAYALGWARENFAALKLIAQKDNYITKEIPLTVSSFTSGETLRLNVEMHPEAFIMVRIVNIGDAQEEDYYNFKFTNAIFDCSCCDTQWKYFEGPSIDSTFGCRLYGDMWLRYQSDIHTAEIDTVRNDSIWCSAFQTTELEITY